MENPFFKEGDQLAYVVWYDNCEAYEDNHQYIDAIFSSWEKAEAYIIDEYGDRENFKQERLKLYTAVDDLIDMIDKLPTISVLDWTFSDDWSNPRVTIEIWNMTTGKQVHWDDKHIFLVEEIYYDS